MFIVPGNEKAVFEERPVPHGTVHVNFYDSQNLKTPRMFYVYTPPGYESGNKNIPCSIYCMATVRSKLRGPGQARLT